MALHKKFRFILINCKTYYTPSKVDFYLFLSLLLTILHLPLE